MYIKVLVRCLQNSTPLKYLIFILSLRLSTILKFSLGVSVPFHFYDPQAAFLTFFICLRIEVLDMQIRKRDGNCA